MTLHQDRIEIELPPLPCRIGALPGENARTQPVRVSLVVHLDLAEAAASGDLDDALDYGLLHRKIRTRVLAETWTLLESLAGAVLDDALDDARVKSASVMVEKCTPPFESAVGPVRIHMRRQRVVPS